VIEKLRQLRSKISQLKEQATKFAVELQREELRAPDEQQAANIRECKRAAVDLAEDLMAAEGSVKEAIEALDAKAPIGDVIEALDWIQDDLGIAYNKHSAELIRALEELGSPLVDDAKKNPRGSRRGSFGS